MIGKYTNILFNTSVNLSVKFTKVLLKTVILSITHQKYPLNTLPANCRHNLHGKKSKRYGHSTNRVY